jgi:hypothetical protein
MIGARIAVWAAAMLVQSCTCGPSSGIKKQGQGPATTWNGIKNTQDKANVPENTDAREYGKLMSFLAVLAEEAFKSGVGCSAGERWLARKGRPVDPWGGALWSECWGNELALCSTGPPGGWGKVCVTDEFRRTPKKASPVREAD